MAETEHTSVALRSSRHRVEAVPLALKAKRALSSPVRRAAEVQINYFTSYHQNALYAPRQRGSSMATLRRSKATRSDA